MKIGAIVLGLSGAVLLAGAAGLAIWAGMGSPLVTLYILISEASAVSKLVYLVMLGLAVWLAIVGTRREPDRSMLIVLGLIPPGLGLAATLIAVLSVWIAMQQTHVTALFVIAPTLAEGLTPLAFGLLLGGAAFGRMPSRQASL